MNRCPARAATLPLGSGYSNEVKWDGFRAIVSTEHGLRVRSRRGWDMTTLLSELAKLPTGLVLDGELVAPDEDGRPSFPRLCAHCLLEELDFQGPHWCTTPVFEDGPALFASVEEQGLEGIVAKPLASPYRPGERGWIKVENRASWRSGQELELAQRRRRTRVTV